jgi:hypothetical protein
MSAFASSEQANPWLCFKRLFQAVPGSAGDAVVMTTVDHTLIRGSEPHDRAFCKITPQNVPYFAEGGMGHGAMKILCFLCKQPSNR